MLIVRTVVAEPYRVPSPSMVPTLLVGDELIGSKFAYGYGKYSSPIGLLPDFDGRLFDKAPERGDVVVFRLPRDPSTTYVKRLIGLPGDRIQMRAGRLYINDALVPRRAVGSLEGDDALCRDAARRPAAGREHEIIEISDAEPHDDTAGLRRAGPALLHDGRQPRQFPRQPHRRRPTAASASCRRRTWSPASTGCCCRAIPRSAGSTSASGRMPSGWPASFGHID